ncbi:MAG: rane protein [Microbacteriaceae bacterium]|nr:rane protein [Microbacteriaceae bacterium]
MTAADRSKRWWFDVRFAIGVVLVICSVAGVLWVVASADSSVRFYAARAALSPGDRIHRSDLVEESARLPDDSARYLSAGDLPSAGLVVTRAVEAGELIPVSAVGASSGLRVTSLVVLVTGQLARSIEPGAVVDVWSAAATGDGTFGPPSVLASSATVVRVVKPDGVIASGTSTSVELLVSRSKTARMLEAVANAAAISLVPSSIPASSSSGG